MRLLSDAPLDDAALDQFGFLDFARALAEIVDNESTDTPLTVAVSAPWGAGKTSVGSMVQHLLEHRVAERDGDRGRFVCWFNAWDHNDAPHLGAALAAVVAREAAGRRSWWRRVMQPLPAAMLDRQARSRRLVLGVIASLAAALVLVLAPPTQGLASAVAGVEQDKLAGLGGFGVFLVVWLVARRMFAAAKDAARFVDDPGAAAQGSMADVKEQLGHLIRHATRGGRIVIVVDDLERCEPARALEVFQVASQLLGHHGVATLLLADMRDDRVRRGERAPRPRGRRRGTALPGEAPSTRSRAPAARPTDMQRLLRGEPPVASADAPHAPAQRSRRAGRPLRASALALLERVGMRTLVGSLLALTVVFVVIAGALPETTSDDVYAVVGLVLIVLGLLWAATAAVAYARRRRRRRQRVDVEQRVQATLRQSGRSSRELSSEQLKQSALEAADHGLEQHALKAAESYLTVQGPEVERVEEFICCHPPPLPRAAKRMLNQARLLTRIAIDRGMFGGDPELRPAHLGEWISMCERWPEVVERVGADPAEMARLERMAAEGGDLAQALGPVDRLDELAHLLRQEPALAPVVERLIRFEPALDPEPPPPPVTPRAPVGGTMAG